MPEIQLNKGKVTLVSEEDHKYLVDEGQWCCHDGYAIRHTYKILGERHVLRMHRVIIERMTGEPIPEGYEVDHINMDTLDNRRENLRLATRSQNTMNRGHRASHKGQKTSSRYKGVSRDKRSGRWIAQIMFQGKQNWLGYFATEAAAARAYDEKAKELHGKFARLNFPDERGGS